MLSPAGRRAVSVGLILLLSLSFSFAQDPPKDIETLKIDTNLVTVPVIATDINGSYVADLKQEEFALMEDGVAQPIAFFGKVSMPFHVVLMLDTSSSTQDKLRLIQQAAYTFVQQLQPADRVKVISFDDQVRDLNEFTNNRETLRKAIDGTKSGSGTKVYDAMELALNTIRRIQGRKAIVIFTDGMDWHSDKASFNSNVRWLDEEGVIVYPIRYDTRATTERLAREQAGQQLPTLDVIRRQPPGTTAPTFPSDNPTSTTTGGQRTGPFGLPTADEILRRRREEERNRDRYPDPSRPMPDPPERDRERRVPGVPGRSDPERDPSGMPTSGRMPPPATRRSSDDSIGRMLDLAYATADQYLQTLAEKSGGRLLRADTLDSLPAAFAQIAAELRTQYMLGYYPLNKEKDDRYRKIKVTTARKNVVVRARPGYLATATR
ncbi:MAG: VWA domain-containing protein [Acidobacteria bacterium]|nr:VWA domain-containing protein [Acidobacteriota bacterium]